MKKTISKEEINALPLASFQGDIITVSKPSECKDAIDELKKEPYIGFDTETRPSFTKNKSYKVSLLQLSTPNKVFLFRLKTLGLPKPLAQLLNDPTHFKIGLALNQDIKGLQELAPFKARSFIDLQTLAKNSEIEVLSLRGLCGLFLGMRLSKKAKLTNWENKFLSKAQIRYAALDAWVSREIFFEMEKNQLFDLKAITSLAKKEEQS
ncbi:MAG: 3'-5' exonuclease [Bdellovibrionota bacterium]|nr:3'-5' exonuclease [Bdellovibrionota bacterium]|tara:strand:+ start:1679 stop:2302 length:624 start_codon:yes stop_codon:yes gene_type:complete